MPPFAGPAAHAPGTLYPPPPRMAPSRQDLTALAHQALANLTTEGQATIWWERRLAVGEHGISDVVQQTAELVVLRDGRVGAASTTDLTDDGLERAAAAADAHAELDREPVDARCLPDASVARAHDGWDPAVLALDPAAVADELAAVAGDELAIESRAGAARVAIASTRGVDAFEERSFAAAEVHAPGRPVAAATGPDGVDVAALVAAAEAGFHEGAPQSAAAGEPAVVLGPVAVAQLLEALKPELAGNEGLIAARQGDRIVAPCVSLSDSPRFPGTLPRSLDAEGVPREPVPLIQDGVAQRFVSDTATGGSTGHATRPGHAEPWPEHLVLVGGGAVDAAELAAPIELGLFIPAFLVSEHGWLLDGAQLIEAGETTWAANGVAEVDPVAVLAATEALASTQRLVPTDDDSALTIGATLAPALRARGGVTIVG
jgi:predicted Zn-dependent protease